MSKASRNAEKMQKMLKRKVEKAARGTTLKERAADAKSGFSIKDIPRPKLSPTASFVKVLLDRAPWLKEMSFEDRMKVLMTKWNSLAFEKQQEYVSEPLKGIIEHIPPELLKNLRKGAGDAANVAKTKTP